jgi:hypothetical protein
VLCDGCGLLQADEPYWLDEAYRSPIATADTGLVERNLQIARKLACALFFLFDRRGRFADFAGGYGLLTRRMRDIGFDFYWSDPYASNLLARGFELTPEQKPCAAATAFEVLEHVTDPLAFLRDVLASSGAPAAILSTEIFEGAPPPPSWPYYSFATGQHVSFYQRRTLAFLARRLSLELYSTGWLHLLAPASVRGDRFGLVTGRLCRVLYPYVLRRMPSLTSSDNARLLAKMAAT